MAQRQCLVHRARPIAWLTRRGTHRLRALLLALLLAAQAVPALAAIHITYVQAGVRQRRDFPKWQDFVRWAQDNRSRSDCRVECVTLDDSEPVRHVSTQDIEALHLAGIRPLRLTSHNEATQALAGQLYWAGIVLEAVHGSRRVQDVLADRARNEPVVLRRMAAAARGAWRLERTARWWGDALGVGSGAVAFGGHGRTLFVAHADGPAAAAAAAAGTAATAPAGAAVPALAAGDAVDDDAGDEDPGDDEAAGEAGATPQAAAAVPVVIAFDAAAWRRAMAVAQAQWAAGRQRGVHPQGAMHDDEVGALLERARWQPVRWPGSGRTGWRDPSRHHLVVIPGRAAGDAGRKVARVMRLLR